MLLIRTSICFLEVSGSEIANFKGPMALPWGEGGGGGGKMTVPYSATRLWGVRILTDPENLQTP